MDIKNLLTLDQIVEQEQNDCDFWIIGSDLKRYNASYNAKLKLMFFAIPRQISILGYKKKPILY